MKHMITLKDWTYDQLNEILNLASEVKASPDRYRDAMSRKTLIMIFEKPSLRTRVSFEVGMCQMGGDAIFYDLSTSPLGAGKESLHDTVKTLCRYTNAIMARLYSHQNIEEMARLSSAPVINALTDFSHPCQILCDLLTIREHLGEIKGRTLAFLGDGNNNVTHSLLFGCAILGMNIRVGCPAGSEYSPQEQVLKDARRLAAMHGSEILVTQSAEEAADGADVVYTDSWMSYHIPSEQQEERIRLFTPYQVNDALMKQASPNAIFMNCLPAQRGLEQTAEVIDGPQSVVFDQAENRLHIQKAVLLYLMNASSK